MAIYKKVKEACGERGISVHALEIQLDFPRGSIYKWDKHEPGAIKLNAVAKTLSKPIEYFLEV